MENEIRELAVQFMERNGYDEERAMEIAKLNIELVEKMQKGIVEFYFVKKDGTLRQSFGTLKPELLPPMEERDESTNRQPCPTVQVYWDTEKVAWRSFAKSNLSRIV